MHDALKRRCLYYWIDYPSFEKELEIVQTQLPDAPAKLAKQITGFIQALREMDLYKLPGVAETLDWTTALVALDQKALDPVIVDETLGAVLKYQDDVEKVKGAQARSDPRACERRRRLSGQFLHNLLLFGRVLRRLGLDINPGRMMDLVSALDYIEIGRKSDFFYSAADPARARARRPAAVRRRL